MQKLKQLLGLILVAAMVLSFAGCAKTEEETTPAEDATKEAAEEVAKEATEEAAEETTDATDEVLSGELAISGSTSVEKIGVAEAEEFMALNPDLTITYEAIGSSSGIKNAYEGVTVLGATSRNLKDEEKAWGLKEVIIAFDGIAVVTHPTNGATNLTMDQVKGIFKGEITNWSEVGGADGEIVVVSREDGSGTRGAFEELVGFEGELTANAIISEGNGNVQTSVAGNPQAIGYVSLTTADETVKKLTVDGIEATVDNVINETYLISRPFIIIYDESKVTEVALAYIDFILSEEGQVIVEDNHGIRIK